MKIASARTILRISRLSRAPTGATLIVQFACIVYAVLRTLGETMARFQMPDGSFEDGDNYKAARDKYEARRRPGVVAPVVAPPQVVTTVTAVLTPRATFANRSTARFGIGEVVDLGFTTTPAGQAASTFGGLQWRASSGANLITLTNNGNAGTGSFTCGDQAGVVKLDLVTANPAATIKASRQILIVAPSGATMRQAPGTNIYHDTGVPSVGFKGRINLQPTDVSFSNLELREGAASYEGTGIFRRGEVSYQQLAVSYDTIHPVLGAWVPVSAGDSIANGSEVNGTDTVSTSISVIGAGTFTWSIPWLVRVVGKRNEIRVTTAVHSVSTDAAGNMTISKAGFAIARNLNDPTSTY
jgi:hypothetical protein